MLHSTLWTQRLRKSEEQVATISKIEQQMSALDRKVDERLHETRPVWQGVLAELREFRELSEKETQELKKRFDTIQAIERVTDAMSQIQAFISRAIQVIGERLNGG
ncbi:MAG TPA: hypothetical protein VLM38_10605 [Blastocatellia bacterium]|nr:hypothetical protein [Blastocatellia bacterium]